MPTSSQFVFISSTPTIIPSIIFSVLFLFTTCLQLHRIIQTRRRVYIFLFMFSLLRTILFIIRIMWSKNTQNKVLAISSGILISSAFFIIVLAVYNLLIDWVLITTNVSQITTDHSSSQLHSTKLTFYERYSINIVKFLLPAFSLLAVIGSIKEFDSNTLVSLNHSLAKGDILIKISTICFLTSMVFYMILITYFALKYSNKPIQSQLKVLVLYIVGALLLIGLIYRTFMIFAPSTDKINKINKYSWIFYVFESLPEVLILIILGGVILGEWFFEDDNIDLTNIKTVSIGSVNRVNATSNV
ncbi:5440_t:CDS:1 [Funneliformis mosseae]|uniref:5440_t:CDS:1 n=1 Tax=Funneliformis mosseae TaxID=27381 RepID=A0A9N9E6G2_FUNMO|nr:5440_t:CDS:1 [Funneliformis mosseae]